MSQTKTADTPSTRYCLGCGYIIDHLPEPRCPECGRKFDPDNPTTFFARSPSARRTILRHSVTAAAGFVVAMVAILLLMRPSQRGRALHPTELLILVTCIFGGIGVGLAWLSALCGDLTDQVPPWLKEQLGYSILLSGLAMTGSLCAAFTVFCAAVVILGLLGLMASVVLLL